MLILFAQRPHNISCVRLEHFSTFLVSLSLVQGCFFSREKLPAVGTDMTVTGKIAETVRGTNMTQHEMVAVEELVGEIARALVDEPEAVEVQTVARDESTILKLRVAPGDVGKVIGKQGRTARSIRTILRALSM